MLVDIVPSTGISPRTVTVPRTCPQTRQVQGNKRILNPNEDLGGPNAI